jgi:hypothetical protein
MNIKKTPENDPVFYFLGYLTLFISMIVLNHHDYDKNTKQ